MDLDNTTPLLSRNVSSWTIHTLSNGIQFNSNKVYTRHDEQIVTDKQLSCKDLFPQILMSVIAFMLVTQPGINMVYSNIFLNHYEFTDVTELSWLSGILVLCTPIGAIAIGVIMDRIGRKNGFLFTCVPLLISWSIILMARPENMDLIYACRFFAGIGGGMTSMSVIYVSEIAHSSYRQMLLSLNSVFFSIGMLFATIVGTLFQWQAVNVIFFIFTAITAILLVVVLPESPVWLAEFRVDRISDIKKSMRRIYPKNNQIFAEELDRLYYVSPLSTHMIKEKVLLSRTCNNAALDNCTMRYGRFRSRWYWWCCDWLCWPTSQPPTVTRPICLLAIMFFLQQLSGCYTVIFYAIPVYQSVVGTTTLSTLDTVGGGPTQMNTLVVLGVFRLVSSVFACALSTHVGRRPLLIASSSGMAISAILVALTCPSMTAIDYGKHVSAIEVGDNLETTPILPLFGVVAFVCSGSVGVLVFPWTLIGELLPISVRAVAGALLMSYAYVLMFAVLKTFPYFLTSVDGGGDGSMAIAFFMFATASSIMAIYAYACLPETLGKRFHEIEQYFADPPTDADEYETVSISSSTMK